MKIFVTGASGWIGSAVVPELIGAGHEVTGLARSDASAQALVKAGAQVEHGTIDDLDLLAKAAAASDGVIHLAFKHDIAFTGDFVGAATADRTAVDTFGDALAGSGKPFVIASGLLGLTPGQVATERDGLTADSGAGHGEGPSARLATAQATLALADRGVRSSVLRLPPTVHGDGDNGFMTALVGLARQHGNAAYVGDGANRWPAVHRLDAARLFRLATENAPAGSVLHAVGDEGVPIRAIAEVFGQQLNLPVVSVPPEDAAERFSFLGGFIGLDSPASATITRELLDWQPTHQGLIEDLEQGHYFRS
ncbi:MAG TPA: SDR family oxidoreductase [Streptosporangiaceae bacterium]|jgi:nucleoside-diphosphate-sugar epimerase